MSTEVDKEQDRLRTAMEEKLAIIRLMEETIASEGWKTIRAVMESQVRTRRQMDFGSVIKSIDDAFTSATFRAEANGIATCMALPEALIIDAQQDLETIRQRMTEIEDDRADG